MYTLNLEESKDCLVEWERNKKGESLPVKPHPQDASEIVPCWNGHWGSGWNDFQASCCLVLTSEKSNPFVRRALAKPEIRGGRMAMYKLMAFTRVDCNLWQRQNGETSKLLGPGPTRWIHMEVNASIRISNPSPTSPQHWSQDTLRLAWPHPLVLGIFALLPSEELPEAARVNDRQGVDLNHFFAKSACHGSSPVWAGNCWINLINNMIMIWF